MKAITHILVATAMLAAASTLSSCLKDSDTTEFLSLQLCSHVVDADGSNPRLVGDIKYSFNYNISQSTVQVSADGIPTGNSKVSFTTDAMPYQTGVFPDTPGYVRAFSGAGKTAGGEPVLNVKGMESTYFYYFYTQYPGIIEIAQRSRSAYLSFDIDDKYKVCTFMRDSFFGGKTTTRFSGESFENDKALYRVVFSEDLTKATVVIYNAQFAPTMSAMSAIVLENLTVKATAIGYTIEGNNVVPKAIMDNALIEMKRFPFNSFMISTASTDMIKINCNYTVAGQYRGEFTGVYMEGSNTK